MRHWGNIVRTPWPSHKGATEKPRLSDLRDAGQSGNKHRGRHLQPGAIPLLVYLPLVAAAWWIEYPGQLNLDSLDQLTQAAHPEDLNDWHSPAVTWLWSLGTPLAGQPGGALLVQCALVMAFPAVVLARLFGARGWAAQAASALYAATCLSWVAIAGLVLKDTVLLGVVSVVLAAVSLIRGPRGFGVLAMCCAAVLCGAIRPTNFLLVAVAMLCCAGALPGTCQFGWRSVGAGLAAVVLAAVVNPVLNRAVLHARDSHAAEQLIIFDLAGISAGTGTDAFRLLPSWPAGTLAAPWTCYTPNHWDDFAWWGACKGYVQAFEALRRDAGGGPAYRAWIGAIATHPLAYARHRLRYLAALLGNRKPFVTGYPSPANRVGSTVLAGTSSTHGRDMSGDLQVWTNSPAKMAFSAAAILLFRGPAVPLLALAACGAVLLLVRFRAGPRRSAHAVPAALAASVGVANVVMLAGFGVADDGRYLIPTLCCAFVACFELASGWLPPRPTAAGP